MPMMKIQMDVELDYFVCKGVGMIAITAMALNNDNDDSDDGNNNDIYDKNNYPTVDDVGGHLAAKSLPKLLPNTL